MDGTHHLIVPGGTMTDTAHPCVLCGNDRDDRPVVCVGCSQRGWRDLRDLPDLAATIAGLARDPGRSGGTEPVTGSRERPLPLRTAQWSYVGLGAPGDVRADTAGDAACQVGDVPLPDQLWTWCRAAADDLDFTVPHVRRNRPLHAVTRFAGTLAFQHERITTLPWADEYLTAVHSLWTRARTLAEDWPLVHKLPAPCPYCTTLTLRRDNGAGFVYCDDRDGGCSRRWSEQDYRRFVHLLVTEAEGAGWTSSRRRVTTSAGTGT